MTSFGRLSLVVAVGFAVVVLVETVAVASQVPGVGERGAEGASQSARVQIELLDGRRVSGELLAVRHDTLLVRSVLYAHLPAEGENLRVVPVPLADVAAVRYWALDRTSAWITLFGAGACELAWTYMAREPANWRNAVVFLMPSSLLLIFSPNLPFELSPDELRHFASEEGDGPPLRGLWRLYRFGVRFRLGGRIDKAGTVGSMSLLLDFRPGASFSVGIRSAPTSGASEASGHLSVNTGLTFRFPTGLKMATGYVDLSWGFTKIHSSAGEAEEMSLMAGGGVALPRQGPVRITLGLLHEWTPESGLIWGLVGGIEVVGGLRDW